MPLTFSIDDVIFEGLEIPETIDTLGTKQAHVIHEFPGGLRTIRNLGALPIAMRWHGMLTGPDAFARKIQLERKAATGQQVTLSYGPFAWLGEVVRFEAHPRHQFYIPYVLEFEPTEDLSGVTQTGQGAPSSEGQLYDQQSSLADNQQAINVGEANSPTEAIQKSGFFGTSPPPTANTLPVAAGGQTPAGFITPTGTGSATLTSQTPVFGTKDEAVNHFATTGGSAGYLQK